MQCPADVHAVDQQRGEVEVLQRRGPPGVQLRLGLRHEAPTDGALTRAAGAHVRTQRFQTALILARRHADEHLFDDAAVERARVRERLDRGQGQLLAVAPDPRSSDRDLAAAQYDLARRMPGPIRTALGLVRIPGTTDGNPILFQHSPRVPSSPRRRPAAGARPACPRGCRPTGGAVAPRTSVGDGQRLCETASSWRLLSGGVAPGCPTGRITRPGGSRRLKISTARGDIPEPS